MQVATEPTERVNGQTHADSLGARVGWLLPPLVLALYALKPLGPVKDPDAYWHVVAGEHLLQSGEFVLEDPFGAATDKVWILNQWLPEVAMQWGHAAYGLPGVAFLLCLGSLLVGLSVYAACRRRAAPLATALVLALVFVALSGSLSPRPQLVTFALAAVTTSAWLLTREDDRARWWLIPLTWLWACSHGMWFVGPVVGGIVVVGLALERRLPVRALGRLALVPALSVAAAAVTPVGPRLFTSPLQVGGVTAYISEWQRPRLADPAVLAALSLVLVVGLYLLRRRRADWIAILLALAAAAFTLTWARTVGLGAIIAAPLAAAALQELIRQPVTSAPQRERSAAGVAALLSLLLVVVAAPAVAGSPALGPNALDGALGALPDGTVVCNDQVDGGWLLLQHPGLRPTMDTRVELYSVEHIQAYLRFMAGDEGWENYPLRVGCAYAVLPRSAAVVAQMRASGRWPVTAESAGYVLMRLS
ncbi:hypothetical protein GCM10009740_03250 [Terrabacter terrae]|uniref:Glycosyltransferase RgtA/B/C/D-like domain-containing protein n=1 Tax=Terrabacter terrae TaxID=318434 RepID=A0ABP5F7Q9_9MICO